MHHLIKSTSKETGNLQAQFLQALRAALGYVSAMSIIQESPELVGEIFQLTCIHKSATATQPAGNTLNIAKYSLELLIVFCSYLPNGVKLIRKAAKLQAKKMQTQPFANIVHLLQCGDLDVQANTLTLLNVLLLRAPEEKKKHIFFKWQTQINLIDALASISSSEYPETKKQLEAFQVKNWKKKLLHHLIEN